MDFDAKVAELERIVKRYSVTFNSANADRVMAEWRQATWAALETAYVEGYDLAASQIAGETK